MDFYTYLWLREDGTPYYVGKGTGNRAFRKGSPPVDRIILQEWPSETDALQAEQFLIGYYGRKDAGGLLHNFTDGGDGVTGMRHSQESRARISQSLIGNKRGAGHPHHTTPHSLATRLQMAAAARGRKLSEETRRKISRAGIGNSRARKLVKA